MSDFTCDRCQQTASGFWNGPPTCNRCLLLDVIEDAIWRALEHQAETERFGPCVGRSEGLVDGTDIDMGAVADTVLKVFDDAKEMDHESTLREYLTATGWR